MHQEDDICAIATGLVKSAISIIRISGKDVFNKLENIIQFHNNKVNINQCMFNYLYRANLIYHGNILDDVMIALFKAPKSYTGENMAEIYCHGSLYIQQEILKILQKKGIRLAEPGEFSLRAYLNGKMDLTQAEAINDVINSFDTFSHSIAIQQMRGGVGQEIKDIRAELLNLLTYVELELDFSEEDVQFASRKRMEELLRTLMSRIEKLSFSYEYGNAIKNGVSVAIVGDTNVGKSTLMNALLNDERSIVSSVPGTTRDVIEDSFTYKGITFRFADTAGIRTSDDEIEKIGVERAKQKASEAKLLLLLINIEDNENEMVDKIIQWKKKINSKQQLFILLNKIDNVSDEYVNKLIEKISAIDVTFFTISAKYRKNIDLVMDEMYNYVASFNMTGSENIISNARQYNALTKALESAKNAMRALNNSITTDLFAEDLKMVNIYLSELIGEVPSQEVLNEIFSRFCIGK